MGFSFKYLLRRIILVLIMIPLRSRSSPLILQGGPILIISPHQDDVSLGCGALVSEFAGAGGTVNVLYLTDGGASHRGHPSVSSSEISMIRKREACEAKRVLGIGEGSLHFLDLPDGELDSLGGKERRMARERILQHINRVKPATLLIPCRNDGSTEHQSAFKLVSSVLRSMERPPEVLEFPVWAWWSPRLRFSLIRSHRESFRFDSKRGVAVKNRAIRVYRSQIDPLPPWQEPVLPKGFTDILGDGAEYYFKHKI